MLDLIIRDARIVTGDMGIVEGSLGVRDGMIAAITEKRLALDAKIIVKAEGRIVTPGLIDSHVHYHWGPNTPGAPGESYATETPAALLGGVTTAMRMHRTNQPYATELSGEILCLERESYMDVGFHLGIVIPEHLQNLRSYAERHGITSFKLYMAYRGKDAKQLGLSGNDDYFIYKLLEAIASIKGGVLCVHAENAEIIAGFRSMIEASSAKGLEAWAASRPGFSEGEAILRVAYFAEKAGCPIYIVHVSSSEGVDAIAQLKRSSRKAAVYAEVNCQHLTHDATFTGGQLGKTIPPIRSRTDCAAVMRGLEAGLFDAAASDHVAQTKANKWNGDIWCCPPGFGGSATLAPVMLTTAYKSGKLSLQDTIALMSSTPAKIFGLDNRGTIKLGQRADLTIVDLDNVQTVNGSKLGGACDYSIYDGWELGGWPTMTILGGKVVMENREITGRPGDGRFIRRSL